MRGEVRRPRRRRRHHGIIPAGAGRRKRVARLRVSVGDHPRGCGEKIAGSTPTLAAKGSSPRVRGEAGGDGGMVGGVGIIPAGAGRRRNLRQTKSRRRDHPRGCGEKSPAGPLGRSLRGSSPRVRGEEGDVADQSHPYGIIPAGAGRRRLSSRTPFGWRDHPRGCGEKVGGEPEGGVDRGSSPRVRGEGLNERLLVLGLGIIPAGAGRRVASLPALVGVGDHPRGCGEKAIQCLNTRLVPGSSPRVRGEGY